MYVTTPPRWIIHRGKWRRHVSLGITKLWYRCWPTRRKHHSRQYTHLINDDNRVLNYRPPPITDEETYLTRRQRATLSQLRSSHCKLLNSYKKRLQQTYSSSCPDCEIDPHDVPRLFNCNAHPTALTPANLWDRPVKTIRELRFLDLDNLDNLD